MISRYLNGNLSYENKPQIFFLLRTDITITIRIKVEVCAETYELSIKNLTRE